MHLSRKRRGQGDGTCLSNFAYLPAKTIYDTIDALCRRPVCAPSVTPQSEGIRVIRAIQIIQSHTRMYICKATVPQLRTVPYGCAEEGVKGALLLMGDYMPENLSIV